MKLPVLRSKKWLYQGTFCKIRYIKKSKIKIGYEFPWPVLKSLVLPLKLAKDSRKLGDSPLGSSSLEFTMFYITRLVGSSLAGHFKLLTQNLFVILASETYFG